jgi:hypothetical protein
VAEERQSALRSGYAKLGNECAVRRSATDTLKEEKAKDEKAREDDVAAIQVRFKDYRVHHRQKLRNLRCNLESAVRKFGASCLPYPRKGSGRLSVGLTRKSDHCRIISRRRIKILCAMRLLEYFRCSTTTTTTTWWSYKIL